jgi:YrbI family 3-deoxy-D-manno-octulosonate 8-phosphate phosphatase
MIAPVLDPPAAIAPQDARRVRLVILDVDGVMTDGGVYLGATAAGEAVELKRFEIQDGLGIRLLQDAGIMVSIVTGRESRAVAMRAAELGSSRCTRTARPPSCASCRRCWSGWDRLGGAAFLGDDLPDLPILRRVGFPPPSGNATARRTRGGALAGVRHGGYGAVREFAEALLGARGEWSGARGSVRARARGGAVTVAAPAGVGTDEMLERARHVIRTEAASVAALESRIGVEFAAAVDAVLEATGRVIVAGVGKSGIVGRKLAATLTSTGTPAVFLHPVEALHGDLGLVGSGDVAILLSKSGESEELRGLLEYLKRMDVGVVALTGRPESALARQADWVLDCSVAEEACPHDLAPTSSTAAAMAMGDALAVALLLRRGFGRDDFARFHPGGALGAGCCCACRT